MKRSKLTWLVVEALSFGMCLVGIATPAFAQQHETHGKTQKTHQTGNKMGNGRSQKEEKGRPTMRTEGRNDGAHGGREEGIRGGNGRYMNRGEGRRLSEGRFRESFGWDHRFRPGWIGGGYDTFGFGGFTFGFVEPWPVGWAYTDEVYVEDIGGAYFLLNPLYPGVQVEVIIQ